ncbi:nucleotide-binding protein [Ralstonia sp. CHL-2022]|uniref:Nucleotide-binding protein n=1 Tax=Ralstonia mojiangensis TaxID=2953895 RepID=A0ABT2LCY5_9RALS|nr:TIR domain-containing protein [Ralstonia mojiangensis]MCT7313255.1 nucleotide-binding protein [Ralstonia mojiangensis]
MNSSPSQPTMLAKFDGKGGKQRLAEILARQPLLGANGEVCLLLAEAALLVEKTIDEEITQQGAADDDIYFIISGSVRVMVNGRQMASRQAGTHIGEMALADPTARRSATTIAAEACVLAMVKSETFSEIANRHPNLWRAIAVETANRFRERNSSVRAPRNQPIVFIGSTREHLDIAKEIQRQLSQLPCIPKIWTNGVFNASSTTIEDLLRMVKDSDFAVLVVTPDDLTTSRNKKTAAPRDNVIFELGLFMGGIGRERTYVVKPRGVEIKIPTDLLGVTCIEYAKCEPASLSVSIGPVCTELEGLIKRNGPI